MVSQKMEKATDPQQYSDVEFGALHSSEALGRLFRAERKHQGLTLKDFYAVTGLSIRFLSEFERGKPNVSLARVMLALQSLGLEILLFPREEAARLLGERARHDESQTGSSA